MMEWKSVGIMKFPIYGKINKCSKPPTSWWRVEENKLVFLFNRFIATEFSTWVETSSKEITFWFFDYLFELVSTTGGSTTVIKGNQQTPYGGSTTSNTFLMVDPPQTLMLECHGPCHGEIDDQKTAWHQWLTRCFVNPSVGHINQWHIWCLHMFLPKKKNVCSQHPRYFWGENG